MYNQYFGALALVVLAAGAVDAQERRLPQGPSGTVTLPVADYDRLIDRASRPQPRIDTPPVPAVIARADVRARVTGDTATGTLRVDGEVLQRGHTKVLLVSGVTLVEGRSDGRPLPLLQDGDAHAAVLAGPAPFSIALDWAAPPCRGIRLTEETCGM